MNAATGRPVRAALPSSDARGHALMIGLSVAVGRFVEALFWAILRVAGTVTAAVFAAAIVLAVVVILVRHQFGKRRR